MKAITVSRQQGNLIWQQQERAMPQPAPTQYLIKLLASSVNPVDFKVAGKLAEGQTSRVLGWDAVGTVVQAGSHTDSSLLHKQVWYLGGLAADGCQAEYQLVDADLVVPAPAGLTATDAASLPLTGLTALELLLDKLTYQPQACAANRQRPLLLINGAGGVGSVLLQLCHLWQIPVTATASRPQSQQWCLQQGADTVIGHAELATLSAHQFAAVVCAHDTDSYFTEMTRLVAPFGQIIALSGAQR
jgi:NADPH:quinone reductase